MDLKNTIENGESDVQLTTIGEVVGSNAEGAPIKQNFSEEALKAIAAAQADEEILVDQDHESEKGGSTAAAGWLTDIRYEEGKGLFGKIKWTDIGRKLIENRVFRWLSPTFWLNKETKEPVAMRSVALTNRPSQQGMIAPIINSAPVEMMPTGMLPTLTLNEQNKEEDILDMSKEELITIINEAVDAKMKAMNTCADDNKEEKVENESEETVEETKEDKTEDTTVDEVKEEKTEDKSEDKTDEVTEEETKEEVIKEEVLNSSPVVVETKLNPLETLKGAALWSYVNKHPYGI